MPRGLARRDVEENERKHTNVIPRELARHHVGWLKDSESLLHDAEAEYRGANKSSSSQDKKPIEDGHVANDCCLSIRMRFGRGGCGGLVAGWQKVR